MKCPEIFDLHFSPKGREAINRIADIQELGNLLATVLGVSVIVTLFVNRGTGNKRVDTGMTEFNIGGYDWHPWAQAMGRVPALTKKAIRDIAFDMAQPKTSRNKQISRNEQLFWEAIVDGCGR